MFLVLWSPGKAFERILEHRVGPWIPLLVNVGVTAAMVLLLFNIADVGDIMMRQMIMSGQAGAMSAEQMAQTEAFFRTPVFLGGMMAVIGIAPIAFILIASVVAFGIFLLGGVRDRFMRFFSVVAFSFTPGIVGAAAAAAVIFTTNPAALSFNHLRVLSAAVFDPIEAGETTGPLYVLLQNLDLTMLWTLALIVIGTGYLGTKRAPVVLRAAMVFAPWLLLVAVQVGFTALGTM
jgi:hypothetical protein